MMDTTADRNSFQENEIFNFGLVRSEYNPADAFKKIKNCASLNMLISETIVHFRSNNGFTGWVLLELLAT